MSVNGVGLVSRPQTQPHPPDGLRERCVLAQVIGDAANNVDIINSFFDANKGPGLCASTSQLGSCSAVSAR